MTRPRQGAPADPAPGRASTISGPATEGAPPHEAREQDITDAAAMIARVAAAALASGLGGTASLASLSAVRVLAAELDRSELALIEAARDGGATWSLIAAAMGARNRQTAQKRHADLTRRHPRPPAVDARPQEPGEDKAPAGTATLRDDTRQPPAAPKAASGGRRQPVTPKITAQIIVEGRYQLVKAADYAETRAWDVLVSGKRAGMVRLTWRGERSRPGWEGVDNVGLALPATNTGRTTPAGNARTRDAAAVSLLQALLRQQENQPQSTGR
jgi:hypothetical protein